MLFAMTFFMGAGVAICQPAAPTLVGEWFPARIGFATAVYVNGILVGEAIPADLVPVILPHIGNSWEVNLALWSIPVHLNGTRVRDVGFRCRRRHRHGAARRSPAFSCMVAGLA